MKGTITIDCGNKSKITVRGGYVDADWGFVDFPGYAGAAAIGAGYAGNMTGEVYIKGGDIALGSGYCAAGIGGGQETDFTYQGGEGGNVYISGGRTFITVNNNKDESNRGNEAIGAGANDRKSGSVYISHDNNQSASGESYMRVCYMDKGNTFVVNENKRTSKLHSNSDVWIEPCDHTNRNGVSGLTYTINSNGTHNVKCKYCDYNKTVAHTGSDCVCGYSNPKKNVSLYSDAGNANVKVAQGNSFTLPYSEGEIIKANTNPPINYQVKGWNLRGDETGTVYEPGSDVTVTSDMTFNLVTEIVKAIELSETQNGNIASDPEYAKSGETVHFSVEPDSGYSIGNVSYKYLAELDSNNNYYYSDPVPISPGSDGKYQLEIPDLPTFANDIIISAEFTKDPNRVYISGNIENGTITSDKETANKDDKVTLTVNPDSGYSLYKIYCRTNDYTEIKGDIEIELTKVDDTHYTFTMPDESVFVHADFYFEDNVGANLVGYSLSLDGDIGVNFYMELADEIEDSDTAYMKFTIPSSNNSTVLNVPVSDAKRNGKYYVFKCNVAAKEMTSQIKAQIIDDENIGTEYKYSVKEYADYLLTNADADGTEIQKKYAAAAPLVMAMLNYGTYSQNYFGTNTDNPANAILTNEEKALDDVTDIEHTAPATNLPEGVTFASATLSLKSVTTLSLFFKNTSAGDVTFKLGDETITPVDNNGYLQVRITGIKAKELGSDFTVNVGDSGSVTFSPMNYCQLVLRGNYTNAHKDVVKALYKYSQAADTFFNS